MNRSALPLVWGRYGRVFFARMRISRQTRSQSFGTFFGAVFLLNASSKLDYAKHRREQKLMEGLKEAKNKYSASYSQVKS